MRWAVVLVAACYQHAPYAGDGATSGDGHADATGSGSADGAAPQVCSTHIAQACVGAATITLADPIDTTLCTNGMVIDSGQYCLFAADSIVVSTHVHVTGSRPLVLAASTIDITDHLDASSEVGGTRVGAGSGRSCPANGLLPTAASGGAGGSFGTPGGNGGTGGTNGTGGIAQPAFVSIVTGGCPGQRGANAPISSAGPGGGALWLFAGQQLTISGSGTVEANGGGGEGGSASAVGGGGGGGSGGLIGLESPTIVVAGATLGANGGGGGGGSVASFAGGNGGDGAFTSAALGGSGQTKTEISGNGGNGAFMGNTVTSGTSGTSGGGGGGGGGGEGHIYAYGTRMGTPAVVSPAFEP